MACCFTTQRVNLPSLNKKTMKVLCLQHPNNARRQSAVLKASWYC